MVSLYFPGFTMGPTKIVAMWLVVVPWSSSHCTIRRLLLFLAHVAYAIRFVCSQLSACWMVPSCMSSSRFGITHATVGNFAKLVGKLVKGRLSPLWSLEKSVQGACFRTYSPDVQTVEPTAGSPSKSPTKVLPTAISSLSRDCAENVCGHESSVIPCVGPENRPS